MPHIHEKIDFTVEVFIVCKNMVLLRKHDKYGFWLSVGGHIELDEDSNEAAIREVKEEVGIDIKLVGKPKFFEDEKCKELIPPKFLNRHYINETHEHITLVYFATSEKDIVIPSEEEKSEEWKWFTIEELDSEKYELRDNIRFYAKTALEELG
jgi:8-oxo-dGTP pyrophosphatase MutT (NUDIX family)